MLGGETRGERCCDEARVDEPRPSAKRSERSLIMEEAILNCNSPLLRVISIATAEAAADGCKDDDFRWQGESRFAHRERITR